MSIIIGKELPCLLVTYTEICHMKYTDEELFRFNLRRIIRENKWSQKELAMICGIGQPDLSKLLSGEDTFTVNRVSNFCSKLNIEANEFYRSDIVVDKDHNYINVRLIEDEPVQETKVKRTSHPYYEKKVHRLTEREFEKIRNEFYNQGFADGYEEANKEFIGNNSFLRVAEDEE